MAAGVADGLPARGVCPARAVGDHVGVVLAEQAAADLAQRMEGSASAARMSWPSPRLLAVASACAAVRRRETAAESWRGRTRERRTEAVRAHVSPTPGDHAESRAQSRLASAARPMKARSEPPPTVATAAQRDLETSDSRAVRAFLSSSGPVAAPLVGGGYGTRTRHSSLA